MHESNRLMDDSPEPRNERGKVSLKQSEESRDRQFLFDLFKTSSPELESILNFGEPLATHLLEMQFNAQKQEFRNVYPDSEHYLIESGPERVGRIWIDFHRVARILDITILPGFRGQGIGSQVMQLVLDEAGRRGLSCRLKVRRDNPALNFYLKHGFAIIEQSELHYEMNLESGSSQTLSR